MANVLHLISSDHRRGAEVFAVELAEFLTSRGHSVELLAVKASGTPSPLPVKPAGRGRMDPIGFARVRAAAKRSDVVVGFGSDALLIGAIAAKCAGRPFVYRNIGDPSVWGEVRFGSIRVGAPVRLATAIVAIYPEAARTIANLYFADPQRIRVIPRGVPIDRFAPASPGQKQEARIDLGLDPSLSWVAYIGNLSAEKAPHRAVDAIARLPHVGLVVAGSGPLRTELELQAERDAPGRVRFLGMLEDPRPVYRAADALVMPSNTEGIPGAAIEAGLSGLPVIASSVGGLPEVVVDGSTGALVPVGDIGALATAIASSLARAAELGSAARARCVRFFSMDVVGGAWSSLIDDLVVTQPFVPQPRVLQVLASPDRRGAEVFASDLGDRLTLSGATVTNVAVAGSHSPASLDVRILGRARTHPSTLFRLIRQARRHDLIIAHGSLSLWPCAIASTIARRPFVYRNIGDPRFWGSVRLGQIRVGNPLRRAAAVVSLFDEAAEWLIARYRLDPLRVRVIPNGVDAARFPLIDATERATARAGLGLTAAGVVLGYVGALSDEKRPDLAVRTAAAIDGAHLLVVGDGPTRRTVETDAASRLGFRVVFAGSVIDPSALLAAIDILLIPSRTEGLPAVLIEAAMRGIPVVASRVGGIGPLVEELGLGAVVDAQDETGFVRAAAAAVEQPVHVSASSRLELCLRYDLRPVSEQWIGLLSSLGLPFPA